LPRDAAQRDVLHPESELAAVETVLSAARTRDLQRQLSRRTRGEGVLEPTFEGYEPVIGDQPTRR
jgi:ribosomal protection tetracycline resistance protein